MAVARSFVANGYGVCIAAAGVAARAPVGRNPHVPGVFWEHIIEMDPESVAQDPDLENCKARSAAAAVTQARLQEWDSNLIDVKGLPLDGLYSARFGFFDATLYLVDYEFADGVDFSKLLLQVIAKYGPPDRPAGNGSTYDWQFGDVRLTLERSFMGRHTMTFLHQPIRSAVSSSHAAIYAAHIKNRAQSQRGF